MTLTALWMHAPIQASQHRDRMNSSAASSQHSRDDPRAKAARVFLHRLLSWCGDKHEFRVVFRAKLADGPLLRGANAAHVRIEPRSLVPRRSPAMLLRLTPPASPDRRALSGHGHETFRAAMEASGGAALSQTASSLRADRRSLRSAEAISPAANPAVVIMRRLASGMPGSAAVGRLAVRLGSGHATRRARRLSAR